MDFGMAVAWETPAAPAAASQPRAAAQKAARCRKAASPKCATAPPTVKTGLKADVRDEKSRKQFVCRLEQASDGDKKFSTFTVKYGIGKQYSTWQEAKEFTEIWRKAQALTTA